MAGRFNRCKKNFGLSVNGNRQRPLVLNSINLDFSIANADGSLTGKLVRDRKVHPIGCVLFNSDVSLDKLPEVICGIKPG